MSRLPWPSLAHDAMNRMGSWPYVDMAAHPIARNEYRPVVLRPAKHDEEKSEAVGAARR